MRAGTYTARALYKDNPTFSKDPFCPCFSGVRVLLGYPFGERTEVAYAENADVRGTMGLLSRPLLFLSRCPARSQRRGFVLICLSLSWEGKPDDI